MKNILKIILTIFEYLALFFVGYYGVKYAFVAGIIFFGRPIGIIVATLVMLLFDFYILRKEGIINI